MNRMTSFYRFVNGILTLILLVGLVWFTPYLSRINAGLTNYTVAPHLIPVLLISLTIVWIILVGNGWQLKSNHELQRYYDQLIAPYFFYSLMSIGLWAVALIFEFDLIALLAVGLFVNHTQKMVQYVSGTPILRQKPFQIKYPIGWINGLSYPLALYTLNLYIQHAGVTMQGIAGELWAIGLILVSLAIASYQYVKYGNPLTMLASLFFNLLVIIHHTPVYSAANSSILFAGATIWLLADMLFVYLYRKQEK